MTAMDQGERIKSVPALCRREAWRFASWWSDFLLMGIIAAAAWALVAYHFVPSELTGSLGAITATAIGLGVGASLPLVARLSGAWRFGHRLDLRHVVLAEQIKFCEHDAVRLGGELRGVR